MVLLSDPPQGLKDPGSRGAPATAAAAATAALVAPPSSWLSRLFVFALPHVGIAVGSKSNRRRWK